MKNNKKIILISIIIGIILVIILCIFIFGKSKEKTILVCSKEIEMYSGIKQNMRYEVIRSNSYTKLKQTQTLELSSDIYNQLQQKGYGGEFFKQYFINSVEESLEKTFDGYEDFVNYEFNFLDKSYSVDVVYTLNNDSQQYFIELFKLDLHNSDVNTIKAYYEGGDMICEIK